MGIVGDVATRVLDLEQVSGASVPAPEDDLPVVLPDDVEFTGQVTNVDDYLELFDIFVLPSLMEGLGSVLLDAMCFGLPIVASDVGGIPDIIEDGVNGLLVEPDNSASLDAALERLLNDETLREKMRAASLAKADNYSAAAMGASYDKLYRRLLNIP